MPKSRSGKSVFERRDIHFRLHHTYAILFNGEGVASVQFKWPKDGSGTLTCYVLVINAWCGYGQARGFCMGDKATVAMQTAVTELSVNVASLPKASCDVNALVHVLAFLAAMERTDVFRWVDALSGAGYVVFKTS